MENNYYSSLLKLFFPIFLSRVGLFTISIVDAVMLAHYNPLHLSYQSIGDMPITIILLLINGLTQGVLFITSQSYGKRDYQACGRAYLRSLRLIFGLCIFLIPLAFWGKDFLSLFNYDTETIKMSGDILQILSMGIIFGSTYVVSQFFLAGIKRPQVSMYFVVVANFLNIFINWLLMSGNLGFPEMGGIGVAISTTTVRMFLSIGILTYILTSKKFKKYALTFHNFIHNPPDKNQFKLGISATINILSDEGTYMFCLLFISLISIFDVAAYSLAFRFMAMTIMISISFAVAGSVFTSEAYENQNITEIRKNLFSTLNLNNITILIISIAAYFGADNLVGLMTNDALLKQQTIPLIKLMCFVIFFTGAQSVIIINLRAIHDLTIPNYIKIASYPILIPITAYILAYGYNQSTRGVVMAILIGNIAATIALYIRFVITTKKTQEL